MSPSRAELMRRLRRAGRPFVTVKSVTGVRLRDLGAGYRTAGALHRRYGRCAGRSVGV
jgi:hypothetical protein